MFKGLIWVAEQIQQRVDAELNDPEPVRRDLIALHRRLELGELTLPQFEPEEERLLNKLDALEARRRGSHG